MAIDPNIVLGLNPTPQFNAVGDLNSAAEAYGNMLKPALMQAETANIQQNTQNANAANPGIAADSQAKETAANQAAMDYNFKTYMNSQAPSFLTTDQNGNEVPDPAKLAEVAHAGGYDSYLPQLYQAWSATAQANIKTAADQTALNQANYNTGKQYATQVATYLKSMADQGATAGQLQQTYDGFHQNGLSSFGSAAVTPDVMPSSADLPPGGVSDWVNATRSSVITPDQQAQLDIQKQNANAASQNANTTSQNFNLSSGEARAQGVNETNKGAVYTTGIQAYQDMGLSDSSLFNITKTKLQELYGNPNYAALQSAISAHNQLYPGANLTIATPGLLGILQNDAASHTTLGKAWIQAATAVPPSAQPTPQTVTPASPTPPPPPPPPPSPPGYLSRLGSAMVPIVTHPFQAMSDKVSNAGTAVLNALPNPHGVPQNWKKVMVKGVMGFQNPNDPSQVMFLDNK